MGKISAQFWRSMIHAYVQHFPVNRGKRRIMELTAPLYASSKPQLCELPGGSRLRADLREHVQRWIYFFGVYEEDTVRWVRSFLRPGMVVLDVGAHVGQYSLLSAPCVGPTGRVHSFEPNPVTYRLLSNNLALNGFRNVTAHQFAVSDATGEATLYVPGPDNLGEASLQECIRGMSATTVKCVTIDDWASSADLGNSERIDLIKIDVRGRESKVIQGAMHVVARFQPVIVCEFEERFLRSMGTSSVELKRNFSDLGYAADRITASGLVPVKLEEVHGFENLALLLPNASTSTFRQS
jgi:FkbM family methyltransferase